MAKSNPSNIERTFSEWPMDGYDFDHCADIFELVMLVA